MRTYTKVCLHGTFLLLHGDMISEYVNLYGEWCEAEVTLYSRLLLPTSHVVEVGANIGLHTVPLAQICHQGQVLCFEPQRIVFQILNANIALNNLLNVNARQQAVGSEAGTLDIASTDYSTPWNYGSFSVASGFSSEAPFQGVVRHEAVTLQALDDVPELMAWSDLALLKIDVEGAEQAVLRGAERTIKRHQPAIFIENNNSQTGDALIATLRKMDYDCYWFVASRYRENNFNQAHWRVDGHDINMLCLPRGRTPPAGLMLTPANHFSELGTDTPIYE